VYTAGCDCCASYSVAFDQPAWGLMFILELCMDVYFWVDIVVNLMTAYYDDGRVRHLAQPPPVSVPPLRQYKRLSPVAQSVHTRASRGGGCCGDAPCHLLAIRQHIRTVVS
jgi:hypothetical protein